MRVTSGDFPGVDFRICVRYHQCMRFQFQVTFLRWISVSVSDVISACDFNDKDFSLTTVAVEVLLQVYLYVLFIDLAAISVHVLVAVFGY